MIVTSGKQEKNRLMKTQIGIRWATRCGIAAFAFVVCASAFANTKTTAKSSRAALHPARKVCYVKISGTAFPQPCNRLGAIPSTAAPLVIVGEVPPSSK